MKTIISTIFLCVLLSFIPELRAQNIQLHYDFGRSLYDKDLKERPLLTSTVEKFHPDTWGSTYFFVDMDYTSEGVASAYWEIAREVKFWKGPFSAHLEYNGGLAKGFSYKNAYLAVHHYIQDVQRKVLSLRILNITVDYPKVCLIKMLIWQEPRIPLIMPPSPKVSH